MKRFLWITCCTIFALCPLLGWAQGQTVSPTLTLEECLSIAMAHNRSLQLAQQTVQKADGMITEARGVGRPQLALSGGARLYSDEKTIPLAVGIEGSNLSFYDLPLYPDRTGYVGVGVTQVIDISGIIKSGVTAATLGKQMAEGTVESTRNDLEFQVKAAYNDILRAQEMVIVAQEAIDNVQTRRKTAQALVDTGISSQVDIVRADAAMSAAQQSLIAANNAVALSKANLNHLLGCDVNTPFAVQAPSSDLLPLYPYDACLHTALNCRPEIRVAQTNINMIRQQLTLAQRDMKPSMVVNATGNYEMAHRIDSDLVGSVGAALLFPLADGGITRGRVAQVESELGTAFTILEDTKSLVALDVKQAYVTLVNANEQTTTALKELDSATESLRLSRIRYEQGIADQVELSDAELQFTQAQTNVVNARFAQRTAQAALDRAIGPSVP